VAVMGDVTPAHGTCRGGCMAAGSAGVQAGGRLRSCSTGQLIQILTLYMLARRVRPRLECHQAAACMRMCAFWAGPTRCGVFCVAGACVSANPASPRVSSAHWPGACARLQ
jgi:hypothetical protein